jgi:hypothetical protein
MTGERVDLWLDGAAALEVAEAAVGAPGWPPLQRLVEGVAGTSPVQLAEAQRDRDARWPLDCYMYPVPASRVLLAMAFEPGAPPAALLAAALRGEAEALRRVAIELARADRKAVAS